MAFPIVPEKLQVIPIPILPRIGFLQPLYPKERGFFYLGVASKESLGDLLRTIWELWVFALYWLFAVPRHEDGVGFSNLNAYSVYEGDVSRLKVMRSPADGHCVQSDDESFIVILFGAFQKRERNIVGPWPNREGCQ